MSGKAFSGQPIQAASVGAQDVEIDGRPLVGLGGDFWHTAYPIGASGSHLIRAVTRAPGILDSQLFTISQQYLAYRLGGSAGGGVAIELGVATKDASAAKAEALDKPDADGYVAIRIATPSGSDVLREESWDVTGPARGLLGTAAKIRLRIDGDRKRTQRLLVDNVRMEGKPPPPFHPPLWGWADIHCHPMAQAGFGDLLAGHMHGAVEDLGSCLAIHGHEHSNILHPVALATDGGRHNDGALAVTGWTTGTAGPDDELGFRGWPAFDEITHIKTHQTWVRRAYEGGQRLMVALIVHNEMLAMISTAASGNVTPQTDRDTVEPQVRLLREFVTHNRDWCGLARTPEEARALIEANKMAFVLGIETDSINGWVKTEDFPSDDTPENRDAIHTTIHDYFLYLRDLGVVQVNLIHLSDNAFGGMALYDVMFMVNSWQRTGRVPQTEDGFTLRDPDEAISKPVTIASAFWEKVEPVATALGIALPQPAPGTRTFPIGDRNQKRLTLAGQVALVEAMRLGMVVDMDHMSEHSSQDAFDTAMKVVPGAPYPLVAAHNGARKLAPRPLDKTAPTPPPTAPMPPPSEERRNPHTWASESMKSETQLGWIKTTGGMFGHGIAGSDSRGFGSVPNDCPGSSKTVAQGLQYLTSRLEMPVALGTDWNVLLPGPGPRFGPRAASGLEGEVEHGDQAWQDRVRLERVSDALAQADGVLYDSPIRDWRTYRFDNSDLFENTTVHGEGQFLWQALALGEAGTDLTLPEVVLALTAPGATEAPALELALGLAGLPGMARSDFHRAGVVAMDPTINVLGENIHVQQLVDGLATIRGLWTAMRTGTAPPLQRDTAGPMRDFDYNLDGLTHYGLLPDMLQDLRNVGLSPMTMDWFFRSAERYVEVWEQSVKVGSRIPH